MNIDTDRGILTVSFGTSYPEARANAIEAIERYFADSFPAHRPYRAFTSEIIRRRILAEEHIEIDSVPAALQRMQADGIRQVYIQPTHIIPGSEYHKLLKDTETFTKDFEILRVGRPLLSEPQDFTDTVSLLCRHYQLERLDNQECVLFMGHGTEHDANICYQALQKEFAAQQLHQVFIATVEGFPRLEDILVQLEAAAFTDIRLIPFMLVSGDHARNDMYGDTETSWKNRLRHAGYHVSGHLHGLGEIPAIRRHFLSHLQDAIANARNGDAHVF